MNFKDTLMSEVSKLNKKRILLIDGDDPRSVEAANQLAKFNNLEITLLVEKDVDLKVDAKIKVLNMNQDLDKIEKLAQIYVEVRKGKEDIEAARIALKTRPFYAMMLLRNSEIDGVVGGLNYSTADILRAAFKTIGPKENIKTISSVMIMHKEDQTYFFSDISVNPKPEISNLVDIANNAAEFVKSFNIEPKIAFLSFSTAGSARTEDTIKMADATKLFNENYVGIKAIGEVQFDAAISEKVRENKYKQDSFNGEANVYIFPDLNAGNIGYKIAQRLGNYGAIGPIITGVKKPVNDLSRGSSIEDVVNTVLITALQSK
ncbi:UNVERIFIED_CONTAM: phosphate acetyltransferase [Campylobacter lari]